MALALSGTSNGSLNNLSLSSNTGTVLDSANTTFFGADQWRLTTTITASGGTLNYDITSNLERTGFTGAGYLGTGMTESSGIFTFPATGMWLVQFFCTCAVPANDNVGCHIQITTDNSSYDTASFSDCCGDDNGLAQSSAVTFFIFDVTDVSTHKVKFRVESLADTGQISGHSAESRTSMLFQRLGDT